MSANPAAPPDPDAGSTGLSPGLVKSAYHCTYDEHGQLISVQSEPLSDAEPAPGEPSGTTTYDERGRVTSTIHWHPATP